MASPRASARRLSSRTVGWRTALLQCSPAPSPCTVGRCLTRRTRCWPSCAPLPLRGQCAARVPSSCPCSCRGCGSSAPRSSTSRVLLLRCCGHCPPPGCACRRRATRRSSPRSTTWARSRAPRGSGSRTSGAPLVTTSGDKRWRRLARRARRVRRRRVRKGVRHAPTRSSGRGGSACYWARPSCTRPSGPRSASTSRRRGSRRRRAPRCRRRRSDCQRHSAGRPTSRRPRRRRSTKCWGWWATPRPAGTAASTTRTGYSRSRRCPTPRQRRCARRASSSPSPSTPTAAPRPTRSTPRHAG